MLGRRGNGGLLWAGILAAPLLTGAASGEEIRTRSGSVPAPKVVQAPMAERSRLAVNPAAERRRREALLREHHLEVRLPAVPESVRRTLAAPRAVETGVTPVGAASTVQLVVNKALSDAATSDVTSQVGEPSAAARGAEVLMTGNWYAAFSTDGGSSFGYINPETTFPPIAGQPFCCDQVALYDAAHDLMIWFLQHVHDAHGNTIRIAVAHGQDIPAQRWRHYELTPRGIGNWNNQWFDFPDLALGTNYLYVTTNTFDMSDHFTRAVALRLPLASLASYSALSYDYFETPSFSLRPTQGAADVMYFGSHASLHALRLFSWPESAAAASTADVEVGLWSEDAPAAPGPDGKDWLGRADNRITAAWRAGNTVGFAWSAAKDQTFQFPHVRVAVIDRNNKTLVAEPHIANSHFAFAYPAAAPNVDGIIGISLAYGGGSNHPSHAVGALDAAGTSWTLVAAAKGTSGPNASEWGDYLAVRSHGADPKSWVATGFVQDGGDSPEKIAPRYVQFKVGPPTPLTLTLTSAEPDKTLSKGDTVSLRAEMKQGNAPAPSRTVTFKTSDPAAASLSAASGLTDASGVVSVVVRGEATTSGEATITAETPGAATASARVKVPDLSALAALLLIAGIVLLRARFARAPGCGERPGRAG